MIFRCAREFSIDLSETENPVDEYFNLKSHLEKTNLIKSYYPLCSDHRARWTKFMSELHGPSLRYKFNPFLSFEHYTKDNLFHLSRLSCFSYNYSNTTEDSLRRLYAHLQSSYFNDSFFHGKATRCTNEYLTNLTKVRVTPDNECVSFGQRSCEMYIFTYEELKDAFESQGYFWRPDKSQNNSFTEKEIVKLSFLCASEKRIAESSLLYKKRRDLLQAIEKINRNLKSRTDECQRFLMLLKSKSMEEKKRIEQILNKLISLSFYMRGWDGKGTLPLTEETSHVKDQCSVDLKVTNSILELDKIMIPLIENLPLMRYEDDHYVFNNDTSAVTIGDRLNLVKQGDLTHDIRSCIRLSSSKFLLTAMYYLEQMGCETKINPRVVETIG